MTASKESLRYSAAAGDLAYCCKGTPPPYCGLAHSFCMLTLFGLNPFACRGRSRVYLVPRQVMLPVGSASPGSKFSVSGGCRESKAGEARDT